MTARHAQVKKKHHKHRYKVNTEMPALKIRALTMKYSYVPKLSDVFHRHLTRKQGSNYILLH